MPSSIRSPRTLATWLELDYHQRRRLFRGWWGRLYLASLLLGLGCIGAMLFVAGNRSFQSGPLSEPHALFEGNCSLCHQQQWSTSSRLIHGDSVRSVPDQACLQCHAGSHHNPHAARDRCVSCHQEHRGHTALVRTGDGKCVECHRDLKRDNGSPTPFAVAVVRFDASGHPPFRSPSDPGTIRFDHQTHLALDPGNWPRRGENPVPGVEKLECASCHQTEEAGRHMKPINYDLHCKRCHPLTVQLAGNWNTPQSRVLADQFAREPFRHPSSKEHPRTVHAELRDRLARIVSSPFGESLLDTSPAPPTRLPLPLPSAPRSEKEYAWVDRHHLATAQVLFEGPGGCRYCHTVKETRHRNQKALLDLEPSGIPKRWWEHAVFRHDSHRALSCGECHEAGTSRQASDVLLPTKEVCLRCHDASASISARADCVACHRYHDPGDQAKARERGTLSIEALRGR